MHISEDVNKIEGSFFLGCSNTLLSPGGEKLRLFFCFFLTFHLLSKKYFNFA